MNPDKVNRCIDVLCQGGCDVVRATIASLEAGLAVHETHHLDPDEAGCVLRELKSIMAVYDGRECDQAPTTSPRD